jgi:hypothetical protein
MKHLGGARAGSAKEGVQTREVKKSGRKKWQDKMESRQQAQSLDSQVGSPTPPNGRPPPRTSTNEEGVEVEAQEDQHVKGGTEPSSNNTVGKVRKDSDLGGAADSDVPASKRIKFDDP